MSTRSIGKENVGRIAERIVANELEYHGFRVSDLNKDGISPNVDLMAVKDGRPWQIQVKGATYEGWWINYGGCDREIIDGKKHMFNRTKSPLRADIVIFVSVKSPKEYRCVILPIQKAEDAAQINLEYAYRPPNKDGSPKSPNKVWASLRYVPKTKNPERKALMIEEQNVLSPFIDDEQNAATDLWDFEAMMRNFAGSEKETVR